MSTMIEVTLATDGSWALVAEAPIANILLTGPSAQWEIIVADTLPAPEDRGVTVTSLDGAFGSSALEETDNVYARGIRNQPFVIRGISN